MRHVCARGSGKWKIGRVVAACGAVDKKFLDFEREVARFGRACAHDCGVGRYQVGITAKAGGGSNCGVYGEGVRRCECTDIGAYPLFAFGSSRFQSLYSKLLARILRGL